MDPTGNLDEIICSAKGYFQNENKLTELKVIFRNPFWIITRDRSDVVVELTPPFHHKFFHKSSSSRHHWHVEWSSPGNPTKKFYFTTNQAVEARSLDRGLRIAKSSLRSKELDLSLQRTVPKNTRYNNYTPEPFLLPCGLVKVDDNHKGQTSQNNQTKPQEIRCTACGKHFHQSRRVRYWARLSGLICCTTEFDHLVT